MDCKSFIFNPQKQEVITPIYPNQLVKWAVTSTPVIIDKIELPYTFAPVPVIAQLPNNRFVVVPVAIMGKPHLYLREWDNWETVECIEIPAHLRENSTKKMHISCLSMTPCDRYLAIKEGWGEMYLFALEAKLEPQQWHRWTHEWDDYAIAMAFDPKSTLMAVNESCTDAYPLLLRIDDLKTGKLTCLEQFSSDLRCHRGGLAFSPDGEQILFTHYQHNNRKRQAELTTWQIDREACQQVVGDYNDDSDDNDPQLLKEMWKTALPLPQEHDDLNPWQSDAIWLDKDAIAFASGTCLAKVSAQSGHVISTVNIGETINAIALHSHPDTGIYNIILATKNGIKLKQLT